MIKHSILGRLGYEKTLRDSVIFWLDFVDQIMNFIEMKRINFNIMDYTSCDKINSSISDLEIYGKIKRIIVKQLHFLANLIKYSIMI